MWEYAKWKGTKAFCALCDQDEYKIFSCVGETTGSLIRHLKIMYEIDRSDTSTKQIMYNRIYTFIAIYIAVNLFIGLFSTIKSIHNYYVICYLPIIIIIII